MKDLNHIKLYQGENEDILKRPPSLLIKTGTLLICLVLTGILVISNYIMIPDTIHTELVIKKNQLNFLTASNDTIIAPFDSYLLETTYNTTSFFANKGDTLFKMIPAKNKNIQVSFKTHSRYKTILRSNTKHKIVIDEENKNYPFHPFKIKNSQKDTIKVYLNIDPTLLGRFFPDADGNYVLPIQVAINEQSIFDRVISCIRVIL